MTLTDRSYTGPIDQHPTLLEWRDKFNFIETAGRTPSKRHFNKLYFARSNYKREKDVKSHDYTLEIGIYDVSKHVNWIPQMLKYTFEVFVYFYDGMECVGTFQLGDEACYDPEKGIEIIRKIHEVLGSPRYSDE